MMGALVTNSWNTYKGVTVKVLTVMKITHQGKSYPRKLDFQAKVEDYTLSMGDINAAFGAPNDGVSLKHPDFDARTFWPLLVGPDH